MNYAEAKQMIEARDRSGKILTIGYQGRFRNSSDGNLGLHHLR